MLPRRRRRTQPSVRGPAGVDQEEIAVHGG